MPDHRDVMVGLARELGWKRGVEVGIGSGQLFARLLAEGIDMIGVDLGLRPDRKAKVAALGGDVLWMPSVQAAELVDDGWADFIFIDAAHSYEAVKADLDAWEPKVRVGGWFGGHDFHPYHQGVIRAVTERFERIKLLEGWVWVRD